MIQIPLFITYDHTDNDGNKLSLMRVGQKSVT